ncbi:DUF2510 domain-containing protein [Amnibacterium flavum]|uniref:DUF2510 domain-containing protein n=1 Tax=Amnibacterium flavum TaxID=2173173 RepID=A0A2V1HTN8_9MICO|nr:DUF2510 domain-containing protein [Amnibacterium flavum]PVZ95928.1 hypothetical protein DDQ50_05540 [Amnibacterium flavum]
MSDATSSAAPGFYADPSGEAQLRWWNGQQWTADTQPLAQSGPPVQPPLPEGTNTNTLWVWLLVLSPLLSLVSVFAIDWTAYMKASLDNDPAAMLRQLASPGYLISQLLGFVLFAAGVLFAYLDWNALKKLGIVRPFHWAWQFLSPVYIIGRTVVLRRRAHQGLAPLFVFIAVVVVSVIVAIVVVSSAVSVAFEGVDLSDLNRLPQ